MHDLPLEIEMDEPTYPELEALLVQAKAEYEEADERSSAAPETAFKLGVVRGIEKALVAL